MYANLTGSYEGDLYGEHTWRDIYPALRSLAGYLVYKAHVSSWRGQEEDIIEESYKRLHDGCWNALKRPSAEKQVR